MTDEKATRLKAFAEWLNETSNDNLLAIHVALNTSAGRELIHAICPAHGILTTLESTLVMRNVLAGEPIPSGLAILLATIPERNKLKKIAEILEAPDGDYQTVKPNQKDF